MQRYIIVYSDHSEDSGSIKVVLDWEYEFEKYLRASRKDWSQDDYRACADYANELAIKNKLVYETDDNEYFYLD